MSQANNRVGVVVVLTERSVSAVAHPRAIPGGSIRYFDSNAVRDLSGLCPSSVFLKGGKRGKDGRAWRYLYGVLSTLVFLRKGTSRDSCFCSAAPAGSGLDAIVARTEWNESRSGARADLFYFRPILRLALLCNKRSRRSTSFTLSPFTTEQKSNSKETYG